MRLGVFGKIGLAFGALLLAFAGYATFTLLSVHRARQGVVANEAYLELQGAVDAAWKSLNDFAPSLGRAGDRLDPNLPLALRTARKQIDDAVGAIDRYLEKEPSSSRRADFNLRRRQIAALGRQLDALAGELGAAAASVEPRARADFQSHFATLVHGLNRMRQPLRGANGQIAQRLSDDEETSLSMAILLGAAGLAVALAVFLFTLRTLRPLGVLRRRARQVAGGEYAQRTGVTSHDEIGDLAREFDAMADAIQEREQRLIRSERLATVGRMAAQIAHEVRNPLSSIGLNAELLGDELGAGAEEARRLVASIIGEVDRLTEITETYLRFTRLPRPKLEREDLGALVASALALTRGELEKEGIAVAVEIAPDLPELAADEAQLRQALLNLVRNAREALAGAAAKRLTVSVAADRAASRLLVRVSDSGAGIAAPDLGKIFDPFFSTKAQGTGLGLALVQQIVVDHGGQIDVESEPGRGTTFTMAFPVPPPAASAAGGVAVGGGAAPLAEPIVERGEGQVQGGRGGRAEEEGALERGGAGGALAGGRQGAA
ncbi:MAG TPA: ATP-binding protein [Polyangia bacterium]|nr:ATP-binding protein [Polyangia bacterium]